jgi:hypothetical protein
MGGAALSWASRRVKRVARSSVESEFMALDDAVREALSLRRLALELGVCGAETIEIREDNNGARKNAEEDGRSEDMKHVEPQFFAVQEDVEERRVRVTRVDSDENASDIFTKALGRVKFIKFRKMLGVVAVAVGEE